MIMNFRVLGNDISFPLGFSNDISFLFNCDKYVKNRPRFARVSQPTVFDLVLEVFRCL